MARLFIWSLRLLTGISLLAAAMLALVYLFASRSVPDYDATHTVAGISGPVEIARDNSGVPHIFGQSERDVFYGLGFAHAQDRLWQMTMLRRAAQGRLSEIFGARTIAEDELMRRLDIYRSAVASVSAQDEPTQAALAAYAQGVNAWIGIVNDQALGRGAPEFFLFSREIAPWQPQDSIAVLKYLAWQSSVHAEAEVLRALAALRLPPDRLRDLMPDFPAT
ncbi:MAG: penicillin acylase family protein, partial [Pseudomonadota bacterium]